MLLIPIGLILVFFYINIPISGFTVDILPDAVGYILIAWNAFKLKHQSYTFSQMMPLCLFLAVYSVAVRLIAPSGFIGLLASLLELLLQLYLLYNLVRGVEDLERVVGTHLNTAVLERWRYWLTISWGGSFAAAAMSVFFPSIALVGFAIVLVWALLCILFILSFFRTSRRYRLLLRFGSGKADESEDN